MGSTDKPDFEAMLDCQNKMARLRAQAGKTARRPLRSDAARFVKGRPMGEGISSEASRISPDDIAQLGSNAIRASAAKSQKINRSRRVSTTVDREQKSANERMHLIPCLRHFRHFACEAGSDAGSKRDR